MSRTLFIFFLILLNIIRLPLSICLIVLKNFFPFLRKRLDFERKNFSDVHSISFYRENLQADYCFEISSEGELEQVRPLIEFFLMQSKKLEIIFSSCSVALKCESLAKKYPENVRILRLPVASASFINFLYFRSLWQWVSAPVVLLCRYDFYPELLTLGFSRKLILLSASQKKFTWYKKESYNFFKIIICSNQSDEVFFKRQYPKIKIDSFDFRIPRILERLNSRETTLSEHQELKMYLDFLENSPSVNKLILGSAWISDFKIFLGEDRWNKSILSGTLHMLIVPHDLSIDSISLIQKQLFDIFPMVPIYILSKKSTFNMDEFKSKPGIIILNMSGILCELYHYFKVSYVGGGFERSIHSVLEPFLAGSTVVVGGNVQRSAEYDYIKSIAPSEIDLLNNEESFYTLFNSLIEKDPQKEIRQAIFNDCSDKMGKIISEITTC